MSNARCMFPTGTAGGGPRYCGNRAKDVDANGRPICGVHKRGCAGTEWRGDNGRYPHGTAQPVPWSRGEFR